MGALCSTGAKPCDHWRPADLRSAPGGRGALHRQAQSQDDAEGAWVHADLHRVEGDHANASYWYRRAGRAVCSAPPEQEWAEIAAALL